ncbi:hypothetical protein G5C51_40730 [Streptomyces sp. A7024]|uniref:Uncharacterized protein n=1 Tax=Streptomyces coryli TaxID=1128680 RepID=A0A6G4UEU9_9ACTN|nr:hypothetical protein [Streptomyces coryli]NGN70197.1 hypothetical protein [Streptomyces coryli]
MSTTTVTQSAVGVADSPPITEVAGRAVRHHTTQALRAVRIFAGAAVSVVLLGEYADGGPERER